MMMLTEMHNRSDISDEKKMCDFEDDRVAEAEALAAEALRLAEESKRAFERLAEIRASLRYLTADRPKPEPTPEPKTEPLKVETAPEALDAPDAPEEKRDDGSQEAAASPNSVIDPTPSALSPVSILKSPASRKEPKEVRYAPDTYPEVQVKKDTGVVASTPAAAVPFVEDDLIVMLFDAIGIDKICGLEFDEQERLTPQSQKQVQKMAEEIGIVPSASEDAAAAPVILPNVRPEHVSAIKRQILARKMGMSMMDPFASESLYIADSVDQADPPVAEKKVETRSSSPELAAVQPVVEETPAPTPAEAPVEEAEPAKETRVEEPTTEVATTEEIPAPTTTASEDNKQEEPASTTDEDKPAVVVAEAPKDTTSILMKKGLTQLQLEILTRKRMDPMLTKPDPFSGEHDDMDFFPCGSGDVACGATAFPDEEELDANLQKPSSPFCGMGL